MSNSKTVTFQNAVDFKRGLKGNGKVKSVNGILVDCNSVGNNENTLNVTNKHVTASSYRIMKQSHDMISFNPPFIVEFNLS